MCCHYCDYCEDCEDYSANNEDCCPSCQDYEDCPFRQGGINPDYGDDVDEEIDEDYEKIDDEEEEDI
jgi:hypothetical protein